MDQTDLPTTPPELDRPTGEHCRPPGVDDATVEALGKLSEAFEVVEDARGHLYRFHRLTGTADLALGEAVDMLRGAGHNDLADRIDRELVGRNVLEGRWTFQVIEEYDDDYYATFRRFEREAREALVGGRRHLFEAEMKNRERTPGMRHHEAIPDDASEQGTRGAVGDWSHDAGRSDSARSDTGEWDGPHR